MPLFPDHKDALYFSMDDSSELLSRCSEHSFELDGHVWQTVEHYYQALKFENPDYQGRIANALNSKAARKLGRARFKRKRSDFKQVRDTLMTRALYIKAKTHADVSERLLNTGEQSLVENSQFDYYWGCGRDHRGDNHYGKILMKVRKKLLEELNEPSS